MSKIFNRIKNAGKCVMGAVGKAGKFTKSLVIGATASVLGAAKAAAQSLAGTGYEAGTSALEEVANQIVAYVPYVVNLCYALAGVVAVVGAISVYIAMNNEEQDVKNILVLQNTFEKTRKQMKVNTLSINALSDNLNFPMFAKLILKKT